jgi:DNA-binding Xre family transcriptional regulator
MIRHDRIRVAMAAKGWKLKDLENNTGISRQTLGPICDGKAKDARLSTLKTIADALNLKLSDLVEEEEPIIEASKVA